MTGKPNVRRASVCRLEWKLSMYDGTGNDGTGCDGTGNHCLRDANLDDKLKHVGHLAF